MIGYIAGFAFLVCGVGAITSLFGSWMSYTALLTDGAPDAVKMADGMLISLMGQIATTLTLFLGFIIQLIAFHKFSYNPYRIWRVMLITTILAMPASIYPLNLITLVLGLVIMIHLFSKKEFYQEPA